MGKRKGNGLMRDSDVWGDDYSSHHGYSAYNGGKEYKVKRGWDTGDAPKVCSNCDFLPKDSKQKIMINHDVWKALMEICTQVKLEWQALLIGTIDAEGTVHVTGYYIPKQEVTDSSVKNLDLIDDEVIAAKGIVAGVHSHGTMACFFSSTDVEDTNMSLIRHNIVVNNRSEYKAQTRVELPCGMAKFIDAAVYTVGDTPVAISGLENIAERKFGFQTPIDNTVTVVTSDKSSSFNKELDGIRWCPACEGRPEEDGGTHCVCWTSGKRHMLPDFTLENYALQYGRSYELKSHLQGKYGKMEV